MTQRISSVLRAARLARGLSQEGLARSAGITRQSYAAIESGASVPSTDVALRLARALSTTVEALFRLPEDAAAGMEAELVGRVPVGRARVRLARIGGRMLAYPLHGGGGRVVEPADGWGIPAEGGRMRVDLLPDRPPASDLVVMGCDPAFGIVLEALRRDRRVEVLWRHAPSRGALEALAAGQAHVAGVHLIDPETGEYNGPWMQRLIPFPCTRIGFAVWTQDLLLPPGNPKGIRAVADLARPDIRFLNREPGSGTRTLVDDRLREEGVSPGAIPGYAETAASGHFAVAEAVASGVADAGVGIRAAAIAYGLTGIALGEEHYDLVIPDHFLDLPAVQALIDLLGSRSVSTQIESLGGYDVAPMGRPR